MSESHPLVEVKNLQKHFNLKQGHIKAVEDVSFSIGVGKTVGLVGESGSGKSTIGKALLRLFPLTSGKIFFSGKEISTSKDKELSLIRKDMQMIFQDPFSSLNPRMTTAEILKEPLIIHKALRCKKKEEERVYELLDLVGLESSHAGRFPHEFSGGQRQRIGIARALALHPKFIVCDEPIAALDVSIQAQIINLLKSLQDKMGLTYLFISHDLAMVKYLCTDLVVMYLGHLMEKGPSHRIYKNPLHPYTQALLSAIPVPDPKIERKRNKIFLSGEIPRDTPSCTGCVFANRCPASKEICTREKPPLVQVDKDHYVRCHLY